MNNTSNTNDRYFADYTGIQNAKHEILRGYLGGWFPIISRYSGRVIYLDCHAGRGRHRTGQAGSPVVAIRLLLQHSLRTSILNGSEIRFVFSEIDEDNFAALQEEISQIGEIPDGIVIDQYCDDYESSLRQICQQMQGSGDRLAPCLAFVDPYGFRLSMDLLNSMLDFERCELLINFMFRYVDMAIHNEAQRENMNVLFGCDEWIAFREIEDSNERSNAILNLFLEQL